MSSDRHDDIKQFLSEAASGSMPSDKHMVFNVETGKFEVRSRYDRPGDVVPRMDAQDMKAFTHD